jgi:hypothetical protein
MASDGTSPIYVDTPYGLLTAAGRWYHVPEAELREYAGEVLDHVGLEDLVRWADEWVDSPRTVTLWVLPFFLWALPASWAGGAAVLLYVGWALASPAFPFVGAARALSVLSNPFVQGGYYALALSALALNGQMRAVAVGLGAFVLFRWGIVQWAGRRGLRALHRRVYPLPVTDQVLRGLIVRAALKYRVSVPQVDALTSDILENWGAQSDAESDPPSTPSA